MGFLESYLRLPRYQRVLIGLTGITVGWYGPSFMQYLFVDPGVLMLRGPGRTQGQSNSSPTNPTASTQLPLTNNSQQSLPSVDTSSRNN